jgi:hypothetical protein
MRGGRTKGLKPNLQAAAKAFLEVAAAESAPKTFLPFGMLMRMLLIPYII